MTVPPNVSGQDEAGRLWDLVWMLRFAVQRSRPGCGRLLRNRQEETVTGPQPKRGQGKRLNPDYSQVTAYIPTKLPNETKINLIRNGKREFCELVEELLPLEISSDGTNSVRRGGWNDRGPV